METIENILKESWPILATALNSNFSTALIGSLCGAFAGAIAAQRVIEKGKKKELIVSELRNVNAAIMVSFSICNIMLSTKKQHSLSLYENFKKDLKAIEEYNTKRALGELGENSSFHYEADFKTFPLPSMPIDTLKDLIFNKISANGRPLSAMAVLEGAVTGLGSVLEKREKLIEKFKTSISEEDTTYYYFGLTMSSGHTNQEYHDSIEAMHSYVNDVIFFGSLICQDLVDYGKRLREKHIKLIKTGPTINTADFSGPKASNLMPDDNEYKDWLNAFKNQSAQNTG